MYDTNNMRRWLTGLFLLMQVCTACAGEITVRNPVLGAGEEGLLLSAETTVDLGQRLEEAVNRGVTLYFVREFEMSHPRWYWISDKKFSEIQNIRIYYHALTRQYRVASGTAHQGFQTLEEALQWLVRVRNWLVIEKGELGGLKAGETYQSSLRIRLDNSQLPKPLQINVLFVKDWDLSGEARWTYTVPTEAK